MNNNITEDKCSLEVSKLLWKHGMKTPECLLDKWLNINFIPTHAVAIKWIRENFNWNIETGYRNSHKDYSSTIYPMFPNTQVHRTERFKTSEDSVEAALLYTLKNLIP